MLNAAHGIAQVYPSATAYRIHCSDELPHFRFQHSFSVCHLFGSSS
uniref:Uncharacterized protein n=1 Tax=Arundo donax TaxID=35708 RepID=A0A0A9CCI6_ARUDO